MCLSFLFHIFICVWVCGCRCVYVRVHSWKKESESAREECVMLCVRCSRSEQCQIHIRKMDSRKTSIVLARRYFDVRSTIDFLFLLFFSLPIITIWLFLFVLHNVISPHFSVSQWKKLIECIREEKSPNNNNLSNCNEMNVEYNRRTDLLHSFIQHFFSHFIIIKFARDHCIWQFSHSHWTHNRTVIQIQWIVTIERSFNKTDALLTH